MRLCPLTWAHLIGLLAFQISLLLSFVALSWVWLPLAAFVLCMCVAPFFPQWPLFLPVIRFGDRSLHKVCLTFDDGPDPQTTTALLRLLAKYDAKVTFFVVGRNAQKSPDLIRRILAEGHEVANHTQEHDVWLMLRTSKTLFRSIDACQHTLEQFGVRTRAFRAPGWVVNSRLWRVLLRQGLVCIDASLKPRDWGNRRTTGLANKVISKIRAGDIVALHDRRPKVASVEQWLDQIEQILKFVVLQDLEICSLSNLLGFPLQLSTSNIQATAANPAAVFYDRLAPGYEAEIESSGQCKLRRSESEAVSARLAQFLTGNERVLEIGAGTGRFTRLLAKRAEYVVALDISAQMLLRLEVQARQVGLHNIETRTLDVNLLQQDSFGRDFDLICSFSSLEYVADLAPLLQDCAHWLTDAGRLYLVFARRGFFRFFVQIGNALRQGVWLHARSARKTRELLEMSGFEVQRLRRIGWASLLLEVEATLADRKESLSG